jgi:hypothetical protein
VKLHAKAKTVQNCSCEQRFYEENEEQRSAFVIGNRVRALCIGSSKPAEQNQDQNDNEYEAEPAAAIIARPVEGAASEAAKASE